MSRIRVDIPGERASLHARLEQLSRLLLNAWAEGLSWNGLAEREAIVRAKARELRRRLYELRRLERNRKTPPAPEGPAS